MGQEGPAQPSASWRIGSALTMGLTGLLCRTFLLGASRLELHGYDEFLKLLKSREDVESRERGLLTVSNHLSIIDDPLVWGSLPFRYQWNPNNLRWSLGSHDLMYKNGATSLFFNLGQCLPTHRLAHSPYGGLFQPTMTQAVRLLSAQPYARTTDTAYTTKEISDPFAAGELTYTTTGKDEVPAHSEYQTRRHAWVHIFPEGRIHQKEDRTMRYFKWGVSRLILESEPCPDLVPMWIEGFEHVYHESRTAPRFLPRPGKSISVSFGDKVDTEDAFGDLRARWKKLRMRAEQDKPYRLGELPDVLKYGKDAVELRKECTMRVRDHVLRVRRARGWDDEDPKARLVDTWREEGKPRKREGQMADGSWVKDT